MEDMLSPSIHESFISRHGSVADDIVLRALHDAAVECRVRCEKLLSAARTIRANKMASALANEVNLKNVSAGHAQVVSGKVSAAKQRAEAAIAKIESETMAPIPKEGATNFSAEIRAALARMSAHDRDKAIARAINTNDDSTLAAILSAPALLSGLTADELELRRHHWRSKHFEPQMKRVESLKRATNDLDRIGGITQRFFDGFAKVDPTAAKAAELSHQAATAVA